MELTKKELEFTREEKEMILKNEKDYPSFVALIRAQNKWRFEHEDEQSYRPH